MGKYAVRQGRTEATKAAERLQGHASGVLGLIGESAVAPPTAPRPTTTPAPAARPPGARRTTVERDPRRRPPADLAIPDYDSLSASQVVPRLAGLSPAELDAVQRYEAGPPRPQDDPDEGRPAAGQLMGAAPEEGGRPATEDDLPRLAELVGRRRRPSCGPAGAARCGPGTTPAARPYEAALRSELADRRPPRAGGHRRRRRHRLRRRPGRAAGRRRPAGRGHRPLHRARGAASWASARR